MSKKIFWIASYPKSGNTWMRAIISSLFFSEKGKFDFNLLEKINYFDSPEAYEFVKNENSEDFPNLGNMMTLYKYRNEAQKRAVIGSSDFAFFKTHSSNLKIKNYEYANNKTTRGLIYLVRDPRDIAISWSAHEDDSIDKIIDAMINNNCIMKTSEDLKGIPMHLSSWDQNVLSWSKLEVPKLIIKYETLIKQTNKTLKEIIFFFEKNYNFSFNDKTTLLNNILKTTSFDVLKKKEEEGGFKESLKSNFFRKGKLYQWKDKLSQNQIMKIENTFHKTMKMLGYL